jgi:hypothetical protein
MKTVGFQKETTLEPEFETLLRGLVGRVPFLKLLSINKKARLSPTSTDKADLVAEVAAGDRKWTLLVEAKRLGQPREARTAVLQLEHDLRLLSASASSYGLLVAPFISKESARICTEAGIGYADLAGNARLSFDQVFVETHAEGNPFREKREVQSIFAPRATRALRVLLQGPLRPWKVTELAEASGVSLGWTSAVRQQLLAREWAAEVPGGFKVTKPGAVVDAWVEADDWEKRTRTREYSLLVTEPAEIAARVHGQLEGRRHAFTQWFAAALRHPHTTVPLITAYVEDFPEQGLIEEALLARQVDSGGRLRLVQPRDEGVLNPLQTVQELPLVSDVQIFLDLIHAGLRGDEAAAELRKWPDFAGGWE